MDGICRRNIFAFIPVSAIHTNVQHCRSHFLVYIKGMAISTTLFLAMISCWLGSQVFNARMHMSADDNR